MLPNSISQSQAAEMPRLANMELGDNQYKRGSDSSPTQNNISQSQAAEMPRLANMPLGGAIYRSDTSPTENYVSQSQALTASDSSPKLLAGQP